VTVVAAAVVMTTDAAMTTSAVVKYGCFNTMLEMNCVGEHVLIFESARYGRNDSAVCTPAVLSTLVRAINSQLSRLNSSILRLFIISESFTVKSQLNLTITFSFLNDFCRLGITCIAKVIYLMRLLGHGSRGCMQDRRQNSHPTASAD